MKISTSEMNLDSLLPEPVNPFTESTAAQAAADAATYSNNPETYEIVKSQLLSTGRSSLYDNLKEDVRRKNEAKAIRTSADIARLGDPDAKDKVKRVLESAQETDLEVEALQKQHEEFVTDSLDSRKSFFFTLYAHFCVQFLKN